MVAFELSQKKDFVWLLEALYSWYPLAFYLLRYFGSKNQFLNVRLFSLIMLFQIEGIHNRKHLKL